MGFLRYTLIFIIEFSYLIFAKNRIKPLLSRQKKFFIEGKLSQNPPKKAPKLETICIFLLREKN